LISHQVEDVRADRGLSQQPGVILIITRTFPANRMFRSWPASANGMRDYKSNTRRGYDAAMADVMVALTDADILDLAHFLAICREDASPPILD
jgi:hypothetical protein